MKIQKIEIPSGNITLEGMISIPEGPGPFGLVVVCHPHPLYGGNMFNNVVHTVCANLGEKDLAWVKFNFRGVGKSGGKYSDGIGEQDDTQAAVSFGEKQDRIDPGKIGVCGYSFGSIVAFAVAAKDPRIKAVAGISPFIQPPHLLDHCSHPKLFVTGTRDEYVDPQSLGNQVKKLPEPKELVLFPGADHFWSEDAEAMAEKVGRFFKKGLE
ncbi:MAG: dienelactone hydrolase [Deltaproteobacteria bacterium]|nr:dienelactone hydrolase [Deltaproteobacteria bacterium]